MYDDKHKTEIIRRACRIIGMDYSNSEVLGISPQTLSKWQRGEATPSESRLYDLIETFCILSDHVIEISNRMWDDHRCKAVLFPKGFPQIPHRTDTKRKYRGKHGMDKRTAHARIEFLKRLQMAGYRPTVDFMAGFDLIPPDGSGAGCWIVKSVSKTADGHDILTQRWEDGEETAGVKSVLPSGQIEFVRLSPLPITTGSDGYAGHWEYNDADQKPFAVWVAENSTEAIDDTMMDLLRHIKHDRKQARKEEAEADAILEEVTEDGSDADGE